MRVRHTLVALGVTSALVGCGASAQTSQPKVATAACSGMASDQTVTELYSQGKIARVEPTYRQEFIARAIQPRYVSGAKLYVPAERGMHQAYLERVLSCHAAAATETHPNDPLRVAGVEDIDVTASGPWLEISVTGTDRAAGKAIWERAQALHKQQGEVSVEQVATAPARRAAL